MSAYGKIAQPTRSPTLNLLPRSYPLRPQPDSPAPTCTVFPLSRSTVDAALLKYLAGVFNGVVREGRTYPQMDELTEVEFGDYFFGQDCFVAMLDASPRVTSEVAVAGDGGVDIPEASVEVARTGRDWEQCVLGMYYIKNCNGGFVVPPVHRGLGVGVMLGRSYLHFAPLLGYRGSVFNLVYISNTASVRIWDQLGFTRAGLIPKAGRLKSKVEGGEDEYVDAIVYHHGFQ